MEHWALRHRTLGLLEVCVGEPSELLRVDPGFPQPKKDDAQSDVGTGPEGFVELEAARSGAKVEIGELPAPRPAEQQPTPRAEGQLQTAVRDAPAEGEREDREAGLRGTIAEKWKWFLEYESPAVVVKQQGVPIFRERNMSQRKIRLYAPGEKPVALPDGKFTQDLPAAANTAPARLQLDTNLMSRNPIQIGVRTKDSFIFFDPPPGTVGARRAAKMEASPVKRWLYPLLGGLGKSGWAILVFLLAPVLSKFFTWLFTLILTPIVAAIQFLLGLLPDIHWPDIHWPKIPWPKINWPAIPWPDIHLPTINLPTPPDWVLWMLDHPKFWIPAVIGVVVGVVAIRNARRSRKEKLHAQRQEMAAALNALYEKRKIN